MLARIATRSRCGAILPLTAVCLIGLIGFMALAIDLGMVMVARSQAQTAADAAALAGVRALTGDPATNYGLDDVPVKAIQAAQANMILSRQIEDGVYDGYDIVPGENDDTYVSRPSGQVTVEVGSYNYQYNDADTSQEKFELKVPRASTAEALAAVKVTVRSPYNSWIFGRIFNRGSWATTATATAVHRPRDVVIVIDLSASMRGGSHLTAERWGARSTSMNPDGVFPKFGHYADYSTTSQVGAAMQRVPLAAGPAPGGGSYLQGNNEYSDPSNISSSNESGPPLCDDFYQQNGAGLKAFAVRPASQATLPAGDLPLRKNNNAAGNPFAASVEALLNTQKKNLNFEAFGYACSSSPNLNVSTFTGYTEGPNYWGKTFFIWPPDPRGATATPIAANFHDNGAKDWRQRFFIKVNSSNSNAITWADDNMLLFDPTGSLRAPGATVSLHGKTFFYRINYAAILHWLRTVGTGTDPIKNPFPASVYAGRIRYYTAIPDPTADSGLNDRFWTTDPLTDDNERFWRDYIDFVLGVKRNGTDSYTVQCNPGGNYSGCGPLFTPTSANNATEMAGWPGTSNVYTRPAPCSYAVGYTTAAYSVGHTGSIAFTTNPAGAVTPAAYDYVIFACPQRSPQPYIYCIKNSPAPTSSSFRTTTPLQEDVPAGTLVHIIGGTQTVYDQQAGSAQLDQPIIGGGGIPGEWGYAQYYDATPQSGNIIRLKNLNTYVPKPGDFFTVNGSLARYYTVHSFKSTGVMSGEITLTRPWYEIRNIPHLWNVEFRRPPYIDYKDNPKRPRMQFWFGPMTFVDFTGCENLGPDYLRWPGTAHEAPNWQCKIGVQAAITDIQRNHPNDTVGLCFYSNPTYWTDSSKSAVAAGQHNRPWVPLGQDYSRLKNALWYPLKVVNGQATEIGFYGTDIADVPRARGGTCPSMGFMLAYNMLSNSQSSLRSYSSDAGGRGRKGARKLIIHITDGIANRYADAALAGAGADACYPIRIKDPSNPLAAGNEYPFNQATAGTDNAEGDIAGQLYAIVDQICKPTEEGGYATPQQKVIIHCLAYGSMFGDSYTYSQKQTALTILQKVQHKGNAATTDNWQDFPDYKRIAGSTEQRILKMQQAFTRIMQDGVQVSLVE